MNAARLLGSTPWTRAPLLLFRRPGVFVAVLGAALVLGVAAASAPLFLSSAANASLHQQIDDACGSSIGPTYDGVLPLQHGFLGSNVYADQGQPIGQAAFDARLRAQAAATRGAPRLHRIVTTDFLTRISGGRSASGTVRFLNRTDASSHIHVLRRVRGDGLLISDRGARDFGVDIGDAVQLAGPVGRTTTARIVGVYRDLRDGAAYEDDYWCALAGFFYQNPFQANPPPVYDVVLADQDTALRTAASIGVPFVENSFSYLVDDSGLTTDRAAAVVAGIDRQQQRLYGGGLAQPTDIARFLQRTHFVEDALVSTVAPIAVAGCLVALLVVGASAVYWVERRRVEVDVLVAHGVGPGALGLKAALEMLPAALLGSGAGWGVAIGLVKLVGPSPLLSAGRPVQGLELAAAGLAVALLLLGALSGVRIHAGAERPVGPPRRWPAVVPWEVLLLAGAGAIVAVLVRGRNVTSDLQLGSVAHVDPLLLVFPLLFFVGAVALFGRLLAAGFRRLRLHGSGWPTLPYLALRRVTGAPLVAVLLVAAAALPAAVALYGASISASVRTTLQGEARLHAGADVAMLLSKPAPVPASLRGHATDVVRYPLQRVGGQRVDVLGIDPETFLDAAYMDPTAGGPSPRTLMRRLADAKAGPGKPVPALLADAQVTGRQTLVISQFSGADVRIAVEVTAVHGTLPSRGRSSAPLLLIDRRALAGVQDLRPEMWAAGDEQRIRDAAAVARLPVSYAYLASAVIDNGVYLPVTYTFDYLTALAVLAAAVGLGGLFLYLESRSRSRRLSYVMVRRMGLSRPAHLGSIALELTVALGAGLVLGLGLAQAAAHAVTGPLDLDAQSPPDAILVTSYAALGVVALVVAIAIAVSSLLAQRSLDRAQPAEVLRGT